MNHIKKSQNTFLRWCLSIARSKDSIDSTKSAIVAIAILGIWLTIVIFTATRHEFWRDEVRALSLARAAFSPLDLFELTRHEGHPILWFLLLYIGKSIVDTQLILPIISISVAFAAVVIFLFFSPFPFWIRCLFIFSALPFFYYSVIARNYGISMLLMFVVAMIYRNRGQYPLLMASVLALLANTNIHSAILVCLIAALWAYDTIIEQRPASVRRLGFSFYLSFVIVFAGVLLCVLFTMPTSEDSTSTPMHGISVRNLFYSFVEAVLRPGQTFYALMPKVPPFVISLLLYLAVFGLIHRPNLALAALGSLIAFGVIFRVFYGGSYRHQGLFLVFLLFLYWLFIESLNNGKAIKGIKIFLFYTGFYVSVLSLIFWNVHKTTVSVWGDINLEISSSKAFGEFLNTSESYRDAIIVPEPDYLLESLPYYANNRIYIPREHRFGTTVSWTTKSNQHLSLGELLSLAMDLKINFDQPVFIVLGHLEIYKYEHRKKNYSYNKIFTWNADEFAEFNRLTIPVAKFMSAHSDENYFVYAIK
ncbi:MAG: hypothetical protein JW896_01100 [Deltaproteobacteria bacterium]|nr:hypothetical protein [Deltaproteobacteria bacterium]